MINFFCGLWGQKGCMQRCPSRTPMMHIVYYPYFHKMYKINVLPIFTKYMNFVPIFVQFTFFCLIYIFLLPPILTMMHLCVMLYSYMDAPGGTLLCHKIRPVSYCRLSLC